MQNEESAEKRSQQVREREKERVSSEEESGWH